MPTRRRLTAALVATTLGWAGLVLVAPAPAAQATAAPAAQADAGRDAPHDPATYYASATGLSGTALATELNSIIDGNVFLPYTSGSTDVWDALDVLDQDPNDATKVIDVYSGDSLVLTNKCGSSCPVDGWNREHTWSQSRGSFDTDPGPGTDLFHMRVSRGNTNSSRGNLDFDETVGGSVPGCPSVCTRDGDSFEPRQNIKGDVARGLFYMDVRYNGDADDGFGVNLRMWDQVGNSSSQIGKLSTLVAWSLADPPDDRERWRNDRIDGDYQHNRNPFIDHPEWVCSIWGSSNPTVCSDTNQSPAITSPTTRSTPRDTAFSLPLTATDPNGDPLTWSLVAPAAAHGTASLTGSPANVALSYTPASGYSGPDSVGVQVSDGKGGVATATIQITVTAVNHPPTVEDIGTDEPIMVPKFNSKQITLLGNDPDGDALTYSLVIPPGRGTVTISGNVATYTATSSSGIDGFTYRATDTSDAQSEAGEVTVQIASSPNAPVVTPVSTTTDEDEAKIFTLTANDPDGDTLTYSVTSQPTKGSISREGDEVTYTPHANAHGQDSFGWSVTDGTSTVASTASVTITPLNDLPTATPLAVTTDEDSVKVVNLGGADVDGDTLTFAKASDPAHGTVSITAAGVATYTPTANYQGPDSFTFTVSDGTATSAPATVSITVTSVNDAPSVTGVALQTTAGTPVSATLQTSDPENDPVTITGTTTPAGGSVTFTGATVTYTPAAKSGTDTFTVTVSDGNGGTATAQVSVEVTPLTAQLVVGTPAATRGTPVTTTISATGPSGSTPSGPVTLTAGGVVLGTATLGPDGTATVTWTPASAGVLTLVASYAGDSRFNPATSAPASVPVARSASVLKLSAGKLVRGHKGKVKVHVLTIGGAPATGQVTLTVKGNKQTATLRNGVATFKIAELPDTAKLKVKAKYAGDGQYAAGAGKRTFTLKS